MACVEYLRIVIVNWIAFLKSRNNRKTRLGSFIARGAADFLSLHDEATRACSIISRTRDRDIKLLSDRHLPE